MASFKFSQSDIEKLFVDLYNGDISVVDLPKNLYKATADYLLGGVYDGFGKSFPTIKYGTADYELLGYLKENVYMFSGAKTFQQTMEMSDAMFDGKKLRPFNEFKQYANEIYVKYNGGKLDDAIKPGWLEAEYNTSIAQAGNAKKWSQIEKSKDALPYLIYSTAGRACNICSKFEGVCLPVNHPFWRKYMPTNHFNCLCLVLQAERDEGEAKEWTGTKVNDAIKKANVPEAFRFNPGQAKEIYSTEGKTQHPYFAVPRKYAKFAENNFNLPIP